MSKLRKFEYSGTRGDSSRNHNEKSCPWCISNKTHRTAIQAERADATYDDLFVGEEEDSIEMFYEDLIKNDKKAFLVRLYYPVRAEVWFQHTNVILNERIKAVVVPVWVAKAKGLFEHID